MNVSCDSELITKVLLERVWLEELGPVEAELIPPSSRPCAVSWYQAARGIYEHEAYCLIVYNARVVVLHPYKYWGNWNKKARSAHWKKGWLYRCGDNVFLRAQKDQSWLVRASLRKLQSRRQSFCGVLSRAMKARWSQTKLRSILWVY